MSGNSPLKLGMIGGGEGAYIGGIHRIAARMDGAFTLVAGAFDADPARGQAFAVKEGISPDRAYGSYQDLITGETGRDDRVEMVAICTPNFTHYPIAMALLEAGFDVICEKPLTTTIEDALDLEMLAETTGRFLGGTYTYCGYPMIHEAREMIARGDLGAIRTIQVEYPLEWMAEAIEAEGNAQAAWWTDPKKNGRGGAIGDIGTHAYHLAGFVTGLKLDSLMSDLVTFVPGRQLDDNAHVMLRYQGGARGLLWASQVALGYSNGLKLRVFGEKGGLFWHQKAPNELLFAPLNEQSRTIKRGADYLSPATVARMRTPPGHPDGYLEAISNLYAGFAEAIRSRAEGKSPDPIGQNLLTLHDGVKGVALVDAVVDCHEGDAPVRVRPAVI